MNEDFVTVGKAARMLGVSEQMVRSLADEGILKSYNLKSGHRRIQLESIANLVKGNKQNLFDAILLESDPFKEISERLDALERKVGEIAGDVTEPAMDGTESEATKTNV